VIILYPDRIVSLATFCNEVFRCLGQGKELLKGMLGANLIGFQIDEYSGRFPQAPENFGGRESGMKKKSNPEVGKFLSEHGWDQHYARCQLDRLPD
jgi:trehalose-6-phosphate synthase